MFWIWNWTQDDIHIQIVEDIFFSRHFSLLVVRKKVPSHDGVFGGSMSVKTTTTTTHAVHFWEGYKIEYKMESIGCEWTCRMAAGMIQRNLHVVISIRCIYSDHTEKKKSLPFFFLSRFFPFCFVVVIRVFFCFTRAGLDGKIKIKKQNKTKKRVDLW